MSVRPEFSSECPPADRQRFTASVLRKILIVHLAAFEQKFNIDVRPRCSLGIAQVPDVLVMNRPYRQNNRVILDPPLMVVEILSPDDRMRDTIRRCLDYEQFGMLNIILLDPEEQTTFVFSNGNLIRQDLEIILVPRCGEFPFNTKELLSRLS